MPDAPDAAGVLVADPDRGVLLIWRHRFLGDEWAWEIPGGMVEQDDSDTWPHMTTAAKGARGRKSTLKYQAVYATGAPEGWPGPGIVNEGFTKDDTQWHWWLHWHELMLANA